MRTSRNFFLGKDGEKPLIGNTEAAVRNEKLLKVRLCLVSCVIHEISVSVSADNSGSEGFSEILIF